jgi:ribosomal protein L7/L12
VKLGLVTIEIVTSDAPIIEKKARPRRRARDGRFAPALNSSAPVATPAIHSGPPLATVSLIACGDRKIEVIQAVRKVTDLYLKEAKDLVEDTPAIVKEDVSWSEAEAIKAVLESAGATAAIRSHRQRGNGQDTSQHAGAGYGA